MVEEPKQKFWNRLEIKLVFIIFITTTITSISLYFIVYSQFHKLMLDNMKEQAIIVNQYATKAINKESFLVLNTIEDETSTIYKSMHYELNRIRQIANVRYLYTAKKNENGDYIYLVDGLDSDADDFRHVGMLIEDEIIGDLENCLAGNIFIGDNYKTTDWGAVFITYWPIYDENDNVLGALGMEFDVDTLHTSYKKFALYSALLSLLIIVAVSYIGFVLFRKVSEPFYKKMAHTDFLTGLQNRMSYELSIKEINKNVLGVTPVSVIIFDLNNLKLVNDKYGHAIGDQYIISASEIIEDTFQELGNSYRTGGDEYAVISVGHTYYDLLTVVDDKFVKRINSVREEPDEAWKNIFNIAYGLAEYDQTLDKGLHDTCIRADEEMYVCKDRLKKSSNNRITISTNTL